MSNIIGLLIILLSDPGEPPVFGVVKEFKNQAECIKFLRDNDLPHKERVMCMAVVKPLEA